MNMVNERSCKNTFSWKATLIGGLVAFGLLLLFNLLTIGGGLSSYVRSEKSVETLISLAYLWIAVGSFLILFIAGMVTSMLVFRDCCSSESHSGLLHGFLTWVFYILISLTFLSHLSEASIIAFPQNFFNVSANMSTTSAPSTPTEMSTKRTVAQAAKGAAPPSEAHKLGVATLAAFFIFALEALGACFGAWCGMDICRRYCPPNRNL